MKKTKRCSKRPARGSTRKAKPSVAPAPPAETPKLAPPLTLKEVAAQMGVSERTVNTWIQRGCPRTSIEAVKEWHAEHVLPRQGGPRRERDPEAEQVQQSLQHRINEAKAKDAEESAKSKRLKRLMLKRRLMHIDQVVREAAEIFIEVRAVIDTIPTSIAKESPQQLRTRMYDVAKNAVDRALKTLTGIHLLGSAGAHAEARRRGEEKETRQGDHGGS